MASRQDILTLEKYRKEPATWNVIHMFKEGSFWHAYEWSAWIICVITYNNEKHKRDKDAEPIAVVHKPLGGKKPAGSYAMVGFQMRSLDKYIPNRVKVETIEDKQMDITIELPKPTDGTEITYERLQKAFEAWKNAQPLSKKDDDDDTPTSGGSKDEKEIKVSTSDPDSGWFHKGDHKQVFAYAVETACDKHGLILNYTVSPGNLHDSRTFKGLYDKIKNIGIKTLIADAGYKVPAIAKMLIDDGIEPLFPYKRPQTKEGFFKKYEYAYDEYYDCYVCPNGKTLEYSTTNREGYREYKSCGLICEGCPYVSQCTNSKEHVKIITRHVWEDYMEICEDIRYGIGNKERYKKRKETIERLFGTAKENHGFRYTQMYGKARMEMKVGLTFACMNLKKLAGIMRMREQVFA